jgi:hypothetical protein
MLEKKRMTRGELAELLDISYSSVHSWIRTKSESRKTKHDREFEARTGRVLGETAPRPVLRDQIARALGIPVEMVDEALGQREPSGDPALAEKRREVSAQLSLLDDEDLETIANLVDNLVARSRGSQFRQVRACPNNQERR